MSDKPLQPSIEPDLPPNDGSNAWPFAGDKVIQGTAHYPAEARDLLRWFYEVCRQEGIGLRDAAKEIRYDTSTLYRVCLGKYEGGSLKNICKAILAFRELYEARRALGGEKFVETSISRDIFRVCRRALEYNKMALISGPSQIGKTTALEEFKRINNHGLTKLVRLPASAGVQLMMKEFASACRLSRDCPYETLRERVLKAIDRNHLVIVDEIHQAFASYQKGARMKVLEAIREIHDRTKCGMVLCGTPIFPREMEQGTLKELLEQLNRRCVFRIDLPSPEKLPKADLARIAESFKLPPPEGENEELVRDILRLSGLGMFVAYLRATTELAHNEKERVSWTVFTRAHDILNKGRRRR